MSIYGIGGSNIQRPLGQPGVRDNARAPGQRPAPTTAPATTPLPPQAPKAAPSASQAVPVEPPPGTDPALWSVLSGDERAYFAKVGAMGPLTYGRALQELNAAQLPSARGGRLDVKI
ncbi:MAG TPA: hypothetical protein VHB25_19860 [Gemmatimonadaceae bacterium]|nr:hypothetical protein [Gemmatimonadaceae bacterium]